jgi:hypothetical protein
MTLRSVPRVSDGPRLTVKQSTIFMALTLVVQVVLAVLYLVLVIRPFYVNGLDEVPVEEVESGLHDPAYVPPFCYVPADSATRESNCVDGSTRDLDGRKVLYWAALTACFGPWIGGFFTVVSTMMWLRCWDALPRGSRLLGAFGVLVSFGTFVLISHRGFEFLLWFMD